MIDYQEINENLKEEFVFDLLVRLGAEPVDKGDYFLCKTICHHADSEEANYKLYYYKNSHIFHCYSEDGSQTIFTFLRHYYEVRDIEYNWYEDILQLVLGCSNIDIHHNKNTKYRSIADNYKNQKNIQPLKVYPSGVLNIFTKYYPIEWLQDGITKNSMDKFNIKFSTSENKIIIPHYDIEGNLIGIRGRALNDWEIENLGKYMPVQIENEWYSHPLSLNLYGLNINKENIKKTGIAFIAEGEKSVLLSENFNIPNCTVAVCGSKLNKFAVNILIKNCFPKEVVICFDKEELPHQDIYFNKLYKICKTYNNYCNFSFIYDRDNLLNLKDSPFDKGEEVFKKLLEKRVRVK